MFPPGSIGKIKPLFTRAHPPVPPRTSPVSPLGSLPSHPRTPAAGESAVARQAGRALSAPHATQRGEGAGHGRTGDSLTRKSHFMSATFQMHLMGRDWNKVFLSSYLWCPNLDSLIRVYKVQHIHVAGDLQNQALSSCRFVAQSSTPRSHYPL